MSSQSTHTPEDVHVIPLRRRDGTVRAVTLVDLEDYLRFGNRRWHMLTGRGKRYAARKQVIDGKECAVLLHREILGLARDDPREADHINGDGLDNRRENLRVVTRQQQLQNVPARGGISLFRGVSRAEISRSKPWIAQVRHEGRLHQLGYFATEHEAAEASAAYRREHLPYATE